MVRVRVRVRILFSVLACGTQRAICAIKKIYIHLVIKSGTETQESMQFNREGIIQNNWLKSS